MYQDFDVAEHDKRRALTDVHLSTVHAKSGVRRGSDFVLMVKQKVESNCD